MKRVISLDIDGVLADFTWGWRELLTAHYGGELYSTGAQPTWDFDDPKDQIDATWDRIRESAHFWRGLSPLVTWQEAEMVRYLAKRAEIIYVTNRQVGRDLVCQTTDWLKEYGLPEGHLFATRSKAEVLEGCGALLLGHLEDSPKNIHELEGLGLPVWTRDWQYNRHIGDPRVSSVAEYLAAVS